MAAMTAAVALQPCSDLSDVALLAEPSLYLKPIARVCIAVQLPKTLSTTTTSSTIGKTVSNWEVMEKIKYLAKPMVFTVMKVTTSNLEVIRYEGELDNKELVLKVIYQLEDQTIKLSGFSETLRVHCTEAKLNFPQRHDWTAFFRDAQNLNELKPGERPDTVVLHNIPCKWFAKVGRTDGDAVQRQNDEESTKNADKVSADSSSTTDPSQQLIKADAKQNAHKPSMDRLKEVFGTFGKIRAADVPLLDPSRNQSLLVHNAQKGFGHELVFDAYIQYSEYNAFVKCLTALYGMKLLWKESEDKAFAANIKVEFDKTQHMNEKNIRKRRQDRLEFLRLQKLKDQKAKKDAKEAEKKRLLEEQRMAEELAEKEEKKRRREERRRLRRLMEQRKAAERKRQAEEKKRQHEVAVEERKLLVAQRQLESVRLLSMLLDRLKEKREEELAELERIHREQEEKRQKEEARRHEQEKEAEFSKMLSQKEQELRQTLVKAARKEQKKRKQKEEKKLKKLERRERKRLKLLSKGPPDVETKLEQVSDWLGKNFSSAILHPIANSDHVDKMSSQKLPEVNRARENQMISHDVNDVSAPGGLAIGGAAKAVCRSQEASVLSSFVVVVPASRAHTAMDDEPVFEAPVNVLYC